MDTFVRILLTVAKELHGLDIAHRDLNPHDALILSSISVQVYRENVGGSRHAYASDVCIFCDTKAVVDSIGYLRREDYQTLPAVGRWVII